MSCPNCKKDITEAMTHCQYCGQDLVLYKKILKISNLYYNNGLIKAKVRDLSGAITALRYSLELNKANINSRNLLGLIYFELGETVSALSQWVISKHFESEDNDADRYIEAVQFNPTMLNSLNQAVKRYNNALTFAKQGSDDLAIIQLKRVVSLNPRFLKAYQLLALLSMKNKENEKAKKYLIQASQIDVSNTTTLRYMKEIVPKEEMGKVAKKSKGLEKDLSSTIVPVNSYHEDKPNIMAFVNLVIGIVLGIAVTAFLIVPSIDRNQSDGQADDSIDYNEQLEKYHEQEAEMQSLLQDNEELINQVEGLQNQIDAIDMTQYGTGPYDSLFNVIGLYNEEMEKEEENDRDYLAIADALLEIEENDFEADAAVGLLDSLREEVYPLAADIYYDIGHGLYSGYEYEEALQSLQNAYEVDPNHVDAIYFIARAYHRLEDYENAAVYYEIIVDDFSDSRRYGDANSFLNSITE